ncbi:arginase family protein [Kribbella qitaiheensis]|uniref:Arginase family protein n=1 Tax=Kribbella qitaiheensis TaxID=1544730 RepID=A0A7G6WZN2_9ACTN|nr:arginase family protein [Kribbella qitaiheensis]QNE19447.1 arginase family protein [Kribbella qitaiheensis]
MTSIGLTTYVGPAGDHNDRAMQAVRLVGEAVARRSNVEPTVIGRPVPSDPQSWEIELERARGPLEDLAARIEAVMSAGQLPVSAITRCAVALATQPVIARHRPDAVVVWLDAHADINVPDDTETGFLGGLALSGPLGWWDSGLGAGFAQGQAVLVGSRDLDPNEAEHVRAGRIELVELGPGLGDRLAEVIAGRPVSFHLDCDVLEPGVVQTDYQVPAGLSLDGLRECAEAVARSEIVGVEVAEFEGEGQATADELIDALAPMFSS